MSGYGALVTAVLGTAVFVVAAWVRSRLVPVRRLEFSRRRAASRRPPRLAAGLAIVVVAALVVGLLVAAAVAVIVAVQPRVALLRRARRQRRSVQRQLPDALDTLVVLVRSGWVPAQAVHEAIPLLDEPIRTAFARVDHRRQRGERFADALSSLDASLGPAASGLVDGLVGADRYGLPLAPVLDRLAADARELRSRQAAVEARQLPVRLAFPLVCCTLPSFVLLTLAPLLAGALSSLGDLRP